MQVIAIANHKGGVGKTATALNLGAALTSDIVSGGCGVSERTLLVDLDFSSGSLTAACGVNGVTGTMAEVMASGMPLRGAILETGVPDLHLAPARVLDGVKFDRVSLRRALFGVRDLYSVVLIDCPPVPGSLMDNALLAAQWVIAPTHCNGTDLRGLVAFLKIVYARKKENPMLALMGILPTFYEGFNIHRDTLVRLREKLPVFKSVVRRAVAIEESMAAGLPLALYQRTHPLVEVYRELGAEVNTWVERHGATLQIA